MSEDLNKKINQITSMLGQEKIPDNIKNLLSNLANATNANNSNDTDESYKTLTRVKNIMDRLNASNHDDRVILLNAVKPFVNLSRQKKLEGLIKILKMVSLSSLLDENSFGNI